MPLERRLAGSFRIMHNIDYIFHLRRGEKREWLAQLSPKTAGIYVYEDRYSDQLNKSIITGRTMEGESRLVGRAWASLTNIFQKSKEQEDHCTRKKVLKYYQRVST